jgi:hypothetical protein
MRADALGLRASRDSSTVLFAGAGIMKSHFISTDAGSAATMDFVRADAASLASHMSRCASAQGRFFLLRAGLQGLRETLLARIVTVGVCAIMVGGLILVM